jgi:TRAP transporter TAXI family solute receptor
MAKKIFIAWISISVILAAGTMSLAAEFKNVVLASSSMGGTAYLAGSAFVEAMKKQIPGINFISQPGVLVQNMTAIEDGVIQIGMGDTGTQRLAYEGKPPFKKAHKNLRYLGLGQPMPTQLLVPKDSKIKNIADLYNKRINVLPKGSVTRFIVEAMLEKYGITYESIQKNGGIVHGVSYSDAANMMQNGQLDMLTSWSLVTSHVLTVISNPGIRVLPVDKADEILKDPRLDGYSKVTLKKGAHEGVSEDIPMMVSYLTVCLTADVPDDLAYKIAKVFFETPPLKEFYKREAEVGLGESFDLKNSHVAANIPYHPGVEKYFKEKGARLR